MSDVRDEIQKEFIRDPASLLEDLARAKPPDKLRKSAAHHTDDHAPPPTGDLGTKRWL